MKTYIIIQMQLNDTTNNILNMSNVVRRVEAESKEHALGQFILDTQNIKAAKKIFPIECYELNELRLLSTKKEEEDKIRY